MKVKIDRDACTSCGICSDTCPEVFELGDDDIAEVKVTEVQPELEDSVREAAEDCPEEAIKLE